MNTRTYSFPFLESERMDFINKKDFAMLYINQKNSKLHTHTFIEIAYVERGSCEHVLNGHKSIVKQGNYFFIDLNYAHQYFSIDDEGIQLINCMFLPTFLNPTLDEHDDFCKLVSNYQIGINCNDLLSDPRDYIFNDETGMIKTLFHTMLEEDCSAKFGSRNIIRHILSQVILLSLRQIHNNDIIHSQISDMLITELQKRFPESNLLKKICNEKHYTMPYLSNRFKRELGISFKQYQVNLRISTACKLLITSTLSVREIATLVGYNDINFFISVFKAKTQMTPVEYRKNNLI